MATNSPSEDTRGARHIIRDLYNAAHRIACNDPNCPRARRSNEPSASTNAGASPEEEAGLILLFEIAEDVGECLDLLRTLVDDMDDARSSLSYLSPSSRSSTGDRYFGHHERGYYGPPSPRLYRDQWTQTPALSPPAYPDYLRDYHRSYPHAPAVSPASSEVTNPDNEPPIIDDHEEVRRHRHARRH